MDAPKQVSNEAQNPSQRRVSQSEIDPLTILKAVLGVTLAGLNVGMFSNAHVIPYALVPDFILGAGLGVKVWLESEEKKKKGAYPEALGAPPSIVLQSRTTPAKVVKVAASVETSAKPFKPTSAYDLPPALRAPGLDSDAEDGVHVGYGAVEIEDDGGPPLPPLPKQTKTIPSSQSRPTPEKLSWAERRKHRQDAKSLKGYEKENAEMHLQGKKLQVVPLRQVRAEGTVKAQIQAKELQIQELEKQISYKAAFIQELTDKMHELYNPIMTNREAILENDRAIRELEAIQAQKPLTAAQGENLNHFCIRQMRLDYEKAIIDESREDVMAEIALLEPQISSYQNEKLGLELHHQQCLIQLQALRKNLP